MIRKNVPKRRGCYVTESVTYTPNGKSTHVLRREKNHANGCVWELAEAGSVSYRFCNLAGYKERPICYPIGKLVQLLY